MKNLKFCNLLDTHVTRSWKDLWNNLRQKNTFCDKEGMFVPTPCFITISDFKIHSQTVQKLSEKSWYLSYNEIIGD